MEDAEGPNARALYIPPSCGDLVTELYFYCIITFCQLVTFMIAFSCTRLSFSLYPFDLSCFSSALLYKILHQGNLCFSPLHTYRFNVLHNDVMTVASEISTYVVLLLLLCMNIASASVISFNQVLLLLLVWSVGNV